MRGLHGSLRAPRVLHGGHGGATVPPETLLAAVVVVLVVVGAAWYLGLFGALAGE